MWAMYRYIGTAGLEPRGPQASRGLAKREHLDTRVLQVAVMNPGLRQPVRALHTLPFHGLVVLRKWSFITTAFFCFSSLLDQRNPTNTK